MEKLIIKTGSIEEAIVLHGQIPEFEEGYISEKLPEIDSESILVIIASHDGENVGFSICYDKYKDGSLYIWVDGVLPKYRKFGVYKKVDEYRSEVAKSKGYKSFRIKTQNKRREMLSFLIKQGWEIITFEPAKETSESKIEFTKSI